MERGRATRAELQRELSRLEAKFNAEMRGRMVATPRAIRLKNEAMDVKQRIDEIDRMDAEQLALSKAPIDEVLEVVAIPLLADVMNDLVAGVDGMLARRGCQQTIFGDYVRQIRRATLAMVDTLAVTDSDLPRLLDVNDALIDAVKKKLMSFIKQRLNITH